MMKKILTLLLALVSPALGQSVQQSGQITPGHISVWVTNGVIGDGGSVGGGATLSGSFTLNDFVCANATSSTPSIIDCGFSATGANNWTGVQNFQGGGTSLTRSANDNTTNIATTAFVQAAIGSPSSIVLPQNDIFVGSASNFAVGVAMSGDCTIVAAGTVTCTKTNGVAFAASATIDTTVASNISSGTLPAARMPALTGDVTSTVNTVATTIANNAVTVAKLAQGAANTTLCNPTTGTANFQACTGGQMSANLCPAIVHIFTATASSPLTLDQCNGVNPTYLEVEAVGGGAGAPGSGSSPGAGNNGNASTITYNSVTYTAGAGQTGTAGNNQFGGAGGTVSGCDENIIGGQGGPSQATSAASPGAYGGGTTLSGPTSGGLAATTLTGQTGATNSGAGGGTGGQGGAVASSPGAGGGGTCRKLISTVAGQNSVAFVVGAAVSGGVMGGTGGAGGGGAAGRVKIVERWQ